MEDAMSVMLFTNDLIYYLAKEIDFEFFPSINGYNAILEANTSYFNNEMGQAVSTLLNFADEDINECYNEFVKEKRWTPHRAFAQYALTAAPRYFPEGYTASNFLGYCTMVIGVGLRYLEINLSGTMITYAMFAVSTVLNGFIISNDFEKEGGWDNLYEVCSNFNHEWVKIKFKNKKKRN